MNKVILCSLWSIVLAVGCGGSTVGGSGSGGEGGSGGSATTSTLPAECAVQTEESAPHSLTFRFKGTGPTAVFLREDCQLRYTVTSCGDGYQEGLVLTGQCTIDCSQQNECIQCGACLQEGIPIGPGGFAEHAWAGKTYTFDENNVGCTCHMEHVAPAGKYRITVPLYATEEDALAGGTPAGEVSTDFELPTPGGVVEVPVFLP